MILKRCNHKTCGLLLSLLILVGFDGCGSGTELIGTWADDSYPGGKIKKVLVLGIARDKEIRRSFETILKEQFLKNGIRAISTLEVITADEKLNRETFDQHFRDMNIDAVVVSRLWNFETVEDAQPDTTYAVPQLYYKGFYGYYNAIYDQTQQGPSLSSTRVIRIETSLYETGQGDIIWRGISETFYPSDAREMFESLSEVLIDELFAEGFFPAAK